MNINETSKIVVAKENPLKNMLVEYVGEKLTTKEEGEVLVTVQMIAEALAAEFPEFMMVMAEENWVRGYKQGLDDAELCSTETETTD